MGVGVPFSRKRRLAVAGDTPVMVERCVATMTCVTDQYYLFETCSFAHC